VTAHTQTCKQCLTKISGELVHLGFSDMDAIYCNRCPNVLFIKDWKFFDRIGVSVPDLTAGDKGWLEYDRHLLPYYTEVEKHFPPCSCGGQFQYMAAPRCPQCRDYLLGVGYSDKPVLRKQQFAFVTAETTLI